MQCFSVEDVQKSYTQVQSYKCNDYFFEALFKYFSLIFRSVGKLEEAAVSTSLMYLKKVRIEVRRTVNLISSYDCAGR